MLEGSGSSTFLCRGWRTGESCLEGCPAGWQTGNVLCQEHPSLWSKHRSWDASRHTTSPRGRAQMWPGAQWPEGGRLAGESPCSAGKGQGGFGGQVGGSRAANGAWLHLLSSSAELPRQDPEAWHQTGTRHRNSERGLGTLEGDKRRNACWLQWKIRGGATESRRGSRRARRAPGDTDAERAPNPGTAEIRGAPRATAHLP